MDYAGRMADVERENEDISFTLGGKYFVSSGGAVLRTLSDLVEKEIILTVPYADLEGFNTNEDHRFIEHIHEIAPGRYEIRLGS